MTGWCVFRGERRDGAGFVGSSAEPAEVIVDRWMRRRARWLEVTRDGELVGSIGRHPDTGRRCWWAEAADT